jgi:dienelactone hydrolase
MRLIIGLAAMVFCTPMTSAAVKLVPVTYEYEGVKLKGHLAYDEAVKEKRPGILVVHEWRGLDDYAKKRATMMAELGYVALAADMYGDGKVAEHARDAAAMAGAVRQDVKTWQGRALAAMKFLQAQPQCDSKKIAAIGYCFGGSTVQQLAYSGADVAAICSFHGAPVVPSDDQAKAIKAKIMMCHGAIDNFIPEADCQKLRVAWDKANVDYRFIYYGGAKHSFTVPGAEKFGVDGLKYDEDADRRSWQAMQSLLREVFGK